MKKSMYACFLLVFFVLSCSEDADDTLKSEIHTVEETIETDDNKVAVLKIDYLTQMFEGGQELTFETSSDFSITTNYHSPGDFGSVQLIYSEVGQPIFDGTIIWMGLGERSVPETLQGSTEFETITNPVDMPSENMFELVMYDEFAYYPDDLSFISLWDAIKNLEIVQDYRLENPDATIKVFLYTPSVGVGDPADWDYYIFLKN